MATLLDRMTNSKKLIAERSIADTLAFLDNVFVYTTKKYTPDVVVSFVDDDHAKGVLPHLKGLFVGVFDSRAITTKGHPVFCAIVSALNEIRSVSEYDLMAPYLGHKCTLKFGSSVADVSDLVENQPEGWYESVKVKIPAVFR